MPQNKRSDIMQGPPASRPRVKWIVCAFAAQTQREWPEKFAADKALPNKGQTGRTTMA